MTHHFLDNSRINISQQYLKSLSNKPFSERSQWDLPDTFLYFAQNMTYFQLSASVIIAKEFHLEFLWNKKSKLYTALKVKFSINDLSSECDQVCRKQRIWSHLLKKSLMKIIIFWCSATSSRNKVFVLL